MQVAEDNAGAFSRSLGHAKPNMRFVKGFIEQLDQAGIADNSVDLVTSNCVVNLSPDKPRVLREAYRVLGKGGEFYFSDVYCDRRLPSSVTSHQVPSNLYNCTAESTAGSSSVKALSASWKRAR